MKSTQYSEKVLDHFRNPRNVGMLEGDDVGVGRVGNPVCGDLMEFYIRVKDNRIEDIKFKTFGCGSAIATASMITELAKGKTLEEAARITRQDVANELDGLPPIKMHCSNLAADALRDAINNYKTRQAPKTPPSQETKECREEIIGAQKFIGKGVYVHVDNPDSFNDKRVAVLDTGSQSIELACDLAEHSPRVVFITAQKEHEVDENFKTRFKSTRVKILYESKLVEIDGIQEVEKIRIHDLNENEEYELFTDAVVVV